MDSVEVLPEGKKSGAIFDSASSVIAAADRKNAFLLVVFRRSATLAIFVTCLSALASCGHRSDVMLPSKKTTPGASQVDMLVATTRKPSKNPALLYSGERGDELRLDNVVVSIPPEKNRKIGEVQWPQGSAGDPQKYFVTTKAEPITDSQLMPWFQRTSQGNRRVVLFVHGFNNSYADAVFRFAQLMHDARIAAAPVLFTWPSRDSIMDYVYDRESTTYSRSDLGQLLAAAVRSEDVKDVTIVAHSMGSWLTMEALRDMANREGTLSPKISNVVLASPDIDIDVFRRQIKEIGLRRPPITIFSSRNDFALRLSTWIAGDVQRLGSSDFNRYHDILSQQGIKVVDASGLPQYDPLGHNAFAENADVLRVLRNTLSASGSASPAAVIAAGTIHRLNVIGLGK